MGGDIPCNSPIFGIDLDIRCLITSTSVKVVTPFSECGVNIQLRTKTDSLYIAQAYTRNFADKDGKVWQGGGGRNPPPEAPHLVLTTPEIEGLRPKSPLGKSQQQQSMSLITTGSSNNRRASGNSPQNPNASPFPGMNQDLSSSEPPNQIAPWAASPLARGPEGALDDKFYDGYGFNPACGGQVV